MKAATTTFLALLLIACSTGPEAIDYGKDACHFCKMTIVEKPFGSELVSSKGKVFKFDAIECMVAHLDESGTGDDMNVYVTDHAQPGHLIDGRLAHYLKCPDIPSPMGESLSAHGDADAAKKALGSSEGTVMDWATLISED